MISDGKKTGISNSWERYPFIEKDCSDGDSQEEAIAEKLKTAQVEEDIWQTAGGKHDTSMYRVAKLELMKEAFGFEMRKILLV
ncbi:hypothetical protein Q1695_003604 [Nippostrongylus brasiliensis]|nr:hypothetical protein Q1695_003604 [Nippostrongylus brasiliensis]